MKKSDKLKLAIKKEKDRLKTIEDLKKQRQINKEQKLMLREIKLKRSKLSMEYYRDFFKKLDHSKLVLINMELKNGNHKTFWVSESKDSFKWNNFRYIFDNELKYYNIDFKTYQYDYHEGFSLPIRREFPLKDTKTAIKESKLIQTEYATNPSTLEQFMNSSIIEMMLRGGAIDKMIKILLIICMITGILSLANLLLFMYSQGYFNNLGV